MRNAILSLIISMLFAVPFKVNAAPSAAKNFKAKFKLPTSGVDQVNAITNTGRVIAGTKKGSTVTVSIPTSSLKGTSFYATSGGRFVGPFMYPNSATKGALFLTKNPKDKEKNALASATFKLKAPAAGENYITLTKALKGSIFEKKNQYTLASIPTFGLNGVGSQRIRAGVQGDSDLDGVVDTLDVDADGDGINNIADADTDLFTSGVSTKAGEEIDVPFTALYLSMRDSLNWHINGALSADAVDAVIGGENKFSVAYFFAIPPGTSTSSITGGHVICGSELTYCRPTSDGLTSTGVYSGFSEGNQSLIGQLWSNITTDGNEYSLESFMVGGSTEPVYGASIQPRVGRAAFRPGDNYRVDFTDSDGDVVTSKTLTLPPYFLTAPALRAYNTTSSSASADVVVDYSDSNGPGTSSGNPIVLANSGDFSGKLRVNIWRLQRLTVSPESGDYRDYGHLNYGVLINNNAGEYSCGELYSNLSSSLTEVSSRGTGDSFSSQQGATLWPLVDSSDDFEPSNASDSTTLGNNTISFTVDLSACRIRNGLSAGVHTVNIIAAGVDTGHGANRAAQFITVNIP